MESYHLKSGEMVGDHHHQDLNDETHALSL
jgi:hypothetical protein